MRWETTEPVPMDAGCIPDTFATGLLAVEHGDGFKVLEFYRDRRSPFDGGEHPTYRLLVARIVLPEASIPQFLRAVAAMGETLPNAAERLAHAEVRGSA